MSSCSRRSRRCRSLHVEARPQSGDVLWSQEFLGRLFHPCRIRQIAIAVLEGELGRLDQEMDVVGLVELGHVEAIGHGQHGGEDGEQSTPTPAGSPSKPLTGDVKGAGEEKPKGDQPAAPAEVEPEKEGEMSPKQAAALLQSMKDEEQKVQLDEHKSMRPVYKDW